MITTKEKFTIEADSLSSAKFSLKDENLAHVFNILRNNLYSDKILAVIREISTNAYDANVENGKSQEPIHVTLPNVYDPILKIRDFGKGLSEYDVFNIFSSYGASTKRNSNSFVGTLGMGSKSPFAYAPSFTVTSYHGGMKKVFEAYIDETEIGTISKIIEEKSDEPTGVEVTVAVRKEDINQFIKTAREFYMWFTPMPTFFGYSLERTIGEYLNGLKKIYDSKYGKLYYDQYNSMGSSTNLFVRMGNICYPVTNFNNINSWMSGSGYKLVIDVQIGEVTFTTSRESLEMKQLTVSTINKYLDIIREDVVKVWQQELDSIATPWQAVCHYHAKMQPFQRRVIGDKLVWRDKVLDPGFRKGEITTYAPHKRDGQWVSSADNVYQNGANAWFILNDGGFPTSQTRARLLEAYNDLKQKGPVYFIRSTVSEAQEILNSNEFKGAQFFLLSEVSSAAVKRTKKSFKTREKVFKWNGATTYPYSGNWVSVEAPSKMVYVNVDKYKPLDFTWRGMWDIKNALSSIGVTLEIYGVKKGAVLSKDAISLKEYIANYALDLVKSDEYAKSFKATVIERHLDNSFFLSNVKNGMFNNIKNDCKCPKVSKVLDIYNTVYTQVKKQSVENTIVNLAKSYQSQEIDALQGKLREEAFQEAKQINDCAKECCKLYPILEGLTSYFGTVDRNGAKRLVDYVNTLYKINFGV